MEAITITHNGTTYTLTQDPYLDGTNEAPYYKAYATANGKTYEIRWTPTRADEDSPLEIDNPDNPDSITEIDL